MPKFQIIPALIGAFFAFSLFARDKILEFKGAYFLPTDSRFKDCYKGSALYGPEFTFQLREHKNWYTFVSIDYFKQTGRLLSTCDSNTVRLLPLAVGIKYFFLLRAMLIFTLA